MRDTKIAMLMSDDPRAVDEARMLAERHHWQVRVDHDGAVAHIRAERA